MTIQRFTPLFAIICFFVGLQCPLVQAEMFTEEQLLYHMDEYKQGLHPLPELQDKVYEWGAELTALERISLSEEDLKACDQVRADLAVEQAKWDEENGAEYEEAKAMILKYRALEGEENYNLYRQWHSKKVRLAQARPRAEASDFLAVLSEDAKVVYEDEAARMRFWYVGHGFSQKILDLMLLGLPAEKAIEVGGEYLSANKEAKKQKHVGNGGSGKVEWEDFLANYQKEHGLTRAVEIPDYQEFQGQPEREWHYEINGKAGSIQAKLKKIDSGKVELQAFGGKRGEIPLEAFSDDDRAYLNELLANSSEKEG